MNEPIAITPKQREIIEHSLGVSYPRGKNKPKPYRNYYCTTPGHPELEAIVAIGAMRPAGKINNGANQYYVVTEAGAAAVGHKLPKEYP